jgi:UDP-N-acetylmuramyl pentapeptide phosphotransferase/UDP-N-acetylglucosamine-1-phosphate transferase
MAKYLGWKENLMMTGLFVTASTTNFITKHWVAAGFLATFIPMTTHALIMRKNNPKTNDMTTPTILGLSLFCSTVVAGVSYGMYTVAEKIFGPAITSCETPK